MLRMWSDDAWYEYIEWQEKDLKIVKKINRLIEDIARNGYNQGIGKPEPLKYRKAWSRGINDEHRLVYRLDSEGDLEILSCMWHYKQ